MKRWMSVLLCLLLAFSCLTVVSAEEAVVTIAVEAKAESFAEGDVFPVSIALKDLKETAFYALDVALFYDASVLQLSNADGEAVQKLTLAPALKEQGFSNFYNDFDAKGLVRATVGMVPDTYAEEGVALAGDTEIFTAYFKVLAQGNAKLQVAVQDKAPLFFSGLPTGAKLMLGDESNPAVYQVKNPTVIIGEQEETNKMIVKILDIADVVVEPGAPFEEVKALLPEKVTVALDDGSTMEIAMNWQDASFPAYTGTAGSYVLLKGTLAEVEGVDNYNGLYSMIRIVVKNEDGTLPSVEPEENPEEQPEEVPGETPEEQPETPVFTDLDTVPWAADMIVALAKQNIVSGASETTYEPDRNVTRAEFVAMLVRAFGLMLEEEKTLEFTDVKAEDWFAKAVMSAKVAGITAGYEDGTFRPENLISRQEMAAMAYRTAGIVNLELAEGEATAFADADAMEEYAVEAISRMQQAGIISGLGDGNFGPTQNTTRAQAAVVIYKLVTQATATEK